MPFTDKLLPRDAIAALMIVSGTVLKLSGYNGTIDSILIGIAGVYFGAELFMNRAR